MHDETQVRVDHPLLRCEVSPLDPLRERHLVRRGQQRIAADLVQEELDGVADAGRRAGLVLALPRLSVDRVALVGRGEAVLVAFEQRLELRGFEDAGADDVPFGRCERTERPGRQGEGLSPPLSSTYKNDGRFRRFPSFRNGASMPKPMEMRFSSRTFEVGKGGGVFRWVLSSSARFSF
jgi:hypothetical protein